MIKEWLREIVGTTKEKALEIGVMGLKFDSPQKLENIQIKSVNYLGFTRDDLLEKFKNETDPEISKAIKDIERYKRLEDFESGEKYSFEYKHPKKRRAKKPVKILNESENRPKSDNVRELICILEELGFKEEMKEFHLKKLFDKDNENLRWELQNYIKQISEQSMVGLELLVRETMKKLDELVLAVEKEIEKKKK